MVYIPMAVAFLGYAFGMTWWQRRQRRRGRHGKMGWRCELRAGIRLLIEVGSLTCRWLRGDRRRKLREGAVG